MTVDANGVDLVVSAVRTHLEARHGASAHVRRFLDRFDDVGRTMRSEPTIVPHGEALTAAVGELRASPAETLARLGEILDRVGTTLAWNVDAGRYYAADAPLGAGYRNGNMHTVLANGDDFAMGLFLLLPNVEYRDHRHPAPELYLNLTGPTQWRFDGGEWAEHHAGSIVWNPPERIHATHTGSRPWLSFWAWLSDTDQPCEVIYRSDAPDR